MCFSLVRLDDQLAEQVMEKYVTSEGEIFQARSWRLCRNLLNPKLQKQHYSDLSASRRCGLGSSIARWPKQA